MKTIRLSIFSLLFLLVNSSPSTADFYNCNGLITNSPCRPSDHQEKPFLKENIAPPTTEEDKDKKRKLAMLYNFDADRLSAQTEFGIAVDFVAIKTICLSSSLADCEKLLLDRREYIGNQRLKITEFRDRKKLLEIEDAKNQGDKNNTNVTIINDNSRNINQEINVNPRIIKRGVIVPNNNPYWTPDYSGYKGVPTVGVPTMKKEEHLKKN